MFLDSTIFMEIPPLRAMWAPIGHQAKVPITGSHAKRVLSGVLSLTTGTLLHHESEHYRQHDCHTMFRLLRSHWRGWAIVLFLDRHPAQWAQSSRLLARQLGVELRWLPVACPELNPVDHLWRHVKHDIVANEPTPNLEATVQRACDYLDSLPPRVRLQKAGVLSEGFWLAKLIR